MASSSKNHSAPIESPAKEELNLPLGYHFSPSDDELIHCLNQKILGGKLPAAHSIPTIDLYRYNPDQIPLEEYKYAVEGVWYYFTTRPQGDLVVKDGFWKPESNILEIQHGGEVIGYMQTIPFLWGEPPEGRKSNWVIHEYRVNPDTFEASDDIKEKVQNFVICRVKVIDKSLESRITNTNLKLLLESLGILGDEEDVKTDDASAEVDDDNSSEENVGQNIGDDVKN